MYHVTRNLALYGIFGTGRSGSTWLGSIVNTHPDVAYRFEPFHRLRDPSFLSIRRRLREGRFGPRDLPELYSRLRPAEPSVDRPPFFPKANARIRGKATLWPLARRLRAFGPVYRSIYSPGGTPVVVFKEVTLERTMATLVQDVGMRVVYLVRHPCGVVASLLEGQRAGLMPTRRQAALREILRDHDPLLYQEHAGAVDSYSAAAKEALLWRVDVERGWAVTQCDSRARLVAYEELCRSPLEHTKEIFAHFGLDVPRQTLQGLAEMTSGSTLVRERRSEQWSNDYFSVFRDPREASERWRDKLSAEDQARVMNIVHDCAVYRSLEDAGIWSA